MSLNGISFDAAGFCGRPLVRRVYKGLVVGLAVFIITLVVLREPFRGYLAEVQISGPPTAGVSLDESLRWIKQADSLAAVVTISAGETSTRNQIRMTYISRQARFATARLDELAARWLCQYLPERLTAYRRNVLAELRAAASSAREREDVARQRLDVLRQEQLLAVLQPAAKRAVESESRGIEGGDQEAARRMGGSAGASPSHMAGASPAQSTQQEQLANLKWELSQLLSRCTEDHPEVIKLRKQIAGMEEPEPASGSATEASGPELIPAPGSEHHTSANGSGDDASAAGHFISTSAAARAKENSAANAAGTLEQAAGELAKASRLRQEAELRLNERMQELATEPTAAEWSTAPARVVARLGGTPRSATLAVGGLLASIGAVVMFFVSAAAVAPVRIETTNELATLLEIPVVGNTSAARQVVGRAHATRARVRRAQVLIATRLAEAVIFIAAGACLLSIVAEPALAGQVVADPFGTLSEVVGRFGR